MMLKEELYAMQESYGKKTLGYIDICAPEWLNPRDPIGRVFKDKYVLLREGRVVLAHIVQANELLFNFFPHGDYPAQIVYSTDPLVAEHPYILSNMAKKIYSYKNNPEETIPEEYRQVAKCIANEYDRTSFVIHTEHEGQPIAIQLIPVMIFRKLLPWGRLRGGFLPVLASPNSKTVLILPKRYWTGKFTRAWSIGQV